MVVLLSLQLLQKIEWPSSLAGLVCPGEISLQTTYPGTAREREGNRKGKRLKQWNQAIGGVIILCFECRNES